MSERSELTDRPGSERSELTDRPGSELTDRPTGDRIEPTDRRRRAVALRPMRWWDIDPVMELELRLFPEDAWSHGMYWSELAEVRPGGTRHYTVATTPDGAIVGYAGLMVVSGEGDVQTIAVEPGHQGTGLGSALLADLIAEAARRDCAELLLEVRVDNPRAQRLYERFGFQPVGIRRGYYQPANVDALVMRLDNPQEDAPQQDVPQYDVKEPEHG